MELRYHALYVLPIGGHSPTILSKRSEPWRINIKMSSLTSESNPIYRAMPVQFYRFPNQ